MMVSVLLILSAPIGAEEIGLPVWSAGDTWTYKKTEGPLTYENAIYHSTLKFDVVALQTKHYRVYVTTASSLQSGEKTSGMRNITRNLNGYFREGAQLPFTELEFLQWPLVAGKNWEFEHPLLDGGSFVWRAKVDGWVDVAVPAGRFKAVRIDIEGRPRAGGLYVQHRTVWYAPSVKWKVKEEWSGEWGRIIVTRENYELENYELH
jgi:hypothetical protein